jgi:hypothetical protein
MKRFSTFLLLLSAGPWVLAGVNHEPESKKPQSILRFEVAAGLYQPITFTEEERIMMSVKKNLLTFTAPALDPNEKQLSFATIRFDWRNAHPFGETPNDPSIMGHLLGNNWLNQILALRRKI